MVEGGDTNNAQAEKKKKRKVRPPRPAARQMSYPVIGPNQVSVPTHLYKVHWRFNPSDIFWDPTQVIVVSDPTLTGPQLAAFVVPNEPVEDRHLTEFQVPVLLNVFVPPTTKCWPKVPPKKRVIASKLNL